jgi:hypothetical protein
MFPKWILWFCVGLFGLFLFIGLYQWPPESDPQPSETPNVIKTLVIPSATIAPPKNSLVYLEDVSVIEVDNFNESKGWNMMAGKITDGLLELKGQNWNAISKKGVISEGQGIIIDFRYERGTDFEVIFQYGIWFTDPYRRLGIYCISGIPKANIYLGKNGIGYKNIHGNFNITPDTWYTLMMAFDKEGEFIAIIMDPNDSSSYYRYQERFSEQFYGYSWDLSIGADSGIVYFDNFIKFKFGTIK